MFNLLSIKHRLLILYFTVSLATLVLIGLVLVNEDHSEFSQSVRAQAQAITLAHQPDFTAVMSSSSNSKQQELANRLASYPDLLALRLTDNRGHELFRFQRGDFSWQHLSRQRADNSDDYLLISQALLPGGKNSAQVEIAMSKRRLQQRTKAYRNITIFLVLFLLLMSLLVAGYFQRIIHAPIRELLRNAEQISADQDYSRRVHPTQENEISALYWGFNHFLEVIETTQKQLLEQKYALDKSAIVSSSDCDGVMTYVNDKFCELSGYSRDELLGNNYSMLNSGMHTREFFSNMWQTIKSGHVWHGELADKNKNGDIFWLATTIVPLLGITGEPEQFLVIYFDISERKSIEHDLEQARMQAESANMAKSEFLSRMSHELRTPLNAILGFSQLLLVDELNADQLDNVEEIDKAGKHLLQLINEILDLSRIEAGHIEINIDNVSLNEVIDNCLLLTEPLARQRGITIECQCQTGLYVQADKLRLKQVLLNLLSNAIKYNRSDGSVVLSCKVLDEQRLRMNICDTGEGLSEEQLAELFKPFTRVGAEHGNVEGSGIGLVITRKLLQMMDGRVDVESKPGEGSCFWIELNLAEMDDSADEQSKHDTLQV